MSPPLVPERPCRAILLGTREAVAWHALRPIEGHPSTDGLLDSFCGLASATTDEMISFVSRYGIPEVCQHGRPLYHSGAPCEFAVDDAGRDCIEVDHLRATAKSLAAYRALGFALAARRPGRRLDWVVLPRIMGAVFTADDLGDWKLGRERLGDWTTDLLRACGVTVIADWRAAGRLRLDFEAATFLGALAVLAVREVAMADETQRECDFCHRMHYRPRQPRPGEAICCGRSDCRRKRDAERQRRRRVKG